MAVSSFLSFSRMAKPIEISAPFYPPFLHGSSSSDTFIPFIALQGDKASGRVFVQLYPRNRKLDQSTLVKLTEFAEFCIKGGQLALKIDENTREIITSFSSPTQDRYQKDTVTGNLVLNESTSTVMVNHLFSATPIHTALHSFSCTAKMFYLTLQVVYSVATFLFFTEIAETFWQFFKEPFRDFWQAQAHDIERIVKAPFALIGLLLTPFYGLVNPFGARRLNEQLKNSLYDNVDFQTYFFGTSKTVLRRNDQKKLDSGHYHVDQGLSNKTFIEKISQLALSNPTTPFLFSLGEKRIKASVLGGNLEVKIENNSFLVHPNGTCYPINDDPVEAFPLFG